MGHHNEPTTNEFNPEQTNVLGVYHMTGSVVGPRDMEVTLQVTGVYRANDSGIGKCSERYVPRLLWQARG